MEQWTSVEERLPEERDALPGGRAWGEVLVSTENGSVLSLAWNRIQDWNEGRILPDVRPPRILYWMPMPEAPAGVWKRNEGGSAAEDTEGAKCRT